MNRLFSLKKIDFLLLLSVVLIAGLGLLVLFFLDTSLFFRQAGFVLFGLILMIVLSCVDWRVFRENSYLVLGLYFLSVLLLLGLFFFAPEIRGVRRWYEMGPLLLNPAEFLKITLIILLAKYFSTRHVEMYKASHIFLSGLYVLLPAFLIFRQPDLGTALILVIAWVGILLISGIKLRHFLILCLLGTVVVGTGWHFFLEDYQKDRVIAFMEPDLDPLGIGWGQRQAQIAIGSGGIWGKGLGEGTQTQYGFFPEAHTDYIFSAIAEELGLLGVLFLLSSFVLFFWRIAVIVLKAQSNFPRFFALGISILIFVQVFINVGMNLGLMPIIGTPLPFVSYGGSSIVFNFLGLGILQSIAKEIST